MPVVAPPVAPRRRRTPWVLLAVLAAVLFALAAVVLVTTRKGDTRALPPRPTTTLPSLATTGPTTATSAPPPTPVPAPPDPPTVTVPTTVPNRPPAGTLTQAQIAEVRSFVERTRGLTFKRPVTVDVLAEADYEALIARSGSPAGVVSTDAAALRALGAIPPTLDLDAAAQAQRLAGEGGQYLPASGVVSLRAAPTDVLQDVLAHELTHALDDQWFGLERPAVRLDGDRSLAFSALVEGSAQWVQDRWTESKGGTLARKDPVPEPGVPAIVARMLDFPYSTGSTLIAALRAAGGSKRVDAAFLQPPRSTEQVIHPDRLLAGDEPVAVPDPPSTGEVIARDTYGEQRLLLTIGPVVGDADATTAATGWGGGRSVMWQDDGVECFRATLAMDTPTDATEVGAALRRWAAAGEGRLVSDDGLTLTTCKQLPGGGVART